MKRGMLNMICSVYDPLGFTSPFVLKAKALFQELCRRKVDWDERLPENVAEQWHRWLADLPLLSNLIIPRCLQLNTDPSPLQLHYFSDASELAYGAVFYLLKDEQCSLVMSKARLALTETTSIPCLELLTAVLAMELDQYMKCHLKIFRTRFTSWSDIIILGGVSRSKIFAQNFKEVPPRTGTQTP